MSNYTIISPPLTTPSPTRHHAVTSALRTRARTHVGWIRQRTGKEKRTETRGIRTPNRHVQVFLNNYHVLTENNKINSPLSFPFLCCTTVTHYSHSHLGSFGTHTLTAHSAIYHELHKRGVRVSKRYTFDARGPATHGAAHAAVPSRLLCIYSNYVTSRIHCSPHHAPPEAPERRRPRSSGAEVQRETRMAQLPVTCRLLSFSLLRSELCSWWTVAISTVLRLPLDLRCISHISTLLQS